MGATVLNLIREPDPDDGFRLIQLRARIATAIADGRRTDETLADLATFLTDRIPESVALIATLDRSGVCRVRASDVPRSIQQLIHGAEQRRWFGSWGASLTRGTPTTVPEIAASSLYREHRALLIENNLLGVVAHPITGTFAQTAGVVSVYFQNSSILDPDQYDLIEEVASLASLAVRASERIQHLVDQNRHDPLTGLENREALEEHLAAAIQTSADGGIDLALLFVDIDDLTFVNDSLGHTAGDTVIAATAERIRAQLLPNDLVVRFGGDEFIIVLEQIGTVEDAIAAANRIRASISKPLTVEETKLQVSVAIGITVGSADQTPLELIDEGHAAVVRAKQTHHRGGTAIHDKVLDTQANARLGRETKLREAIERSEFVLYWQPKIDVATGDLAGAEALIRWQHPEEGIVSPDKFLNTAERAGLIDQLTNWVIDQALAETVSLRQAHPTFFAAINLSASQLERPDVVAHVRQALKQHALSAALLTIELTESVLASASVIERLHSLDELGVNLAIDDFGTGYSSLAYVHRLPMSTVKIDRAFIEGLDSTGKGAPVLEAAISMAQALGMTTTIEGVETEGQLAGLRNLGADYAQGYLFSEPVPVEGLHQFL